MSPPNPNEDLLISWKEISQFLKISVRTCARWEKKYSLPIYRFDEKSKTTVYAYKQELNGWLQKRRDNKSHFLKKSQWRMIISLGLALLLGFLLYISFVYTGTVISQPFNFKISNSKIIILDKDGQEIWNYDTEIEELYGENFYRNRFQIKTCSGGPRNTPMLIFRDLNSDGYTEVLIALYAQGEINSGGLFCFNHKGEILWKLNPLRKVTFGRDLITSYSYPDGFNTYDMDGDGQYEIVYVSNHTHFFPTRLLILNNEGKNLGEYWNSGRINDFIATDLNGDNIKELIIVGTNNEHNSGFLAVFDFRKIQGCSPQKDEYYMCKEIEPGSQICYLRFPRTDASIQQYEQEGAIEIDELPNQRILVRVGPGVQYEFDFSLHIKSVRFANEFDELHRILKREGKIQSEIDEYYHRSLAKNILYYDGKNWTSQTRMNLYDMW